MNENVREKLSQIYFNNPTPKTFAPSPKLPPEVLAKKPKKQLYTKKDVLPFIVLIIISVFMLFTLLRYTGETQPPKAATSELTKVRPQNNISSPAISSALLVDDFNQPSQVNKLGGYFGTFTQTPDEPGQFCLLFWDEDNKAGFRGAALRLDYNLESPNSVSNGFWMSLANLDARPYSGLDFFIKGGEDKKYPRLLKLQLKNANQTGTYILNNIEAKWQRVYIGFNDFEGISDLDHLLKLLIIFENKEGEPKTGTVYIDNLQFVKR